MIYIYQNQINKYFFNLTYGIFWCIWTRSLRWNYQNRKFSFSVESYDENTAENDWNCYVAEKGIVLNYRRYKSKCLIAKIEDMNNYYAYILNFPKNNLSKSVTVGLSWTGSGLFIVLKDSASPKTVINMSFIFFRSFF